ncbi:transmembrane and coiled-coil domains-containing protein 7 [Mortierella claussenii]|nr:transmembrane and coiled-coil domains-containing protein 7 [Mortierella claussenii]
MEADSNIHQPQVEDGRQHGATPEPQPQHVDRDADFAQRTAELQARTRELELQLQSNLRMIHALVGTRVDVQNIDRVLQERLAALKVVRAGKPAQVEPQITETEACEMGSPAVGEDGSSNDKNTDVEHQDVRTKFVVESVQLLIQLEEILLSLVRDRELNDPGNDKELLGLMDQRMIHTMLEIIVCWGIYPCLLPGVGMPLNRRVRSNIVQTDLFAAGTGSGPTNSASNDTIIDKPVDRSATTSMLWSIIEPLSKMTIAYSPKVTRFTTLGSILASRHVPDLYAALLQLAYRPLSKPKGTEADSSSTATGAEPIKSKKLTPGNLASGPARTPKVVVNLQQQRSSLISEGEHGSERSRQLQQKEESAKLFHDLFWNTEAASSLEALTSLLSASSPMHPTPTWIKSVSGRFLSQILLRPGGVRVVLEYMQGGADTVKLDQLERIARLVTSVPDQMSSVQEYYRTICPELLDILERNLQLMDPDQDNRERASRAPPSSQLVQTTTFVVGKLLVKNPAICQIEIVAKEVEPLWKWGTRASRKIPVASDTIPVSPSHEQGRKVTVVDEADGENGDDARNSGLDPLVASEYELTKAVLFLHSFLVGNEPSPFLFQAFLGQAFQGLYQLYEFLIQVRSVLREKVKEILVVYMRILDPRDTVETLKAIVMRRRLPVSIAKPWQNLVTHTGQRIGELVDMGCVGESYFAPGPTGGAVLRRRSTQDPSAATRLELGVDVFLDFLSELETSGYEGEILGDLYMYLLDEYQAGKARGSNSVSPRRMLTMLQLILSMTQKLGPSIMGKVTQIIGLANNILEHQCSNELRESIEATENEDVEETDMEILSLVLTLLSAILTENEHLSQPDRHLLSLIMVHLKQLSDHPLIEIRRVAHDLQTLIPTRLHDSSSNADGAPQKTEMEVEMEKYASALAALQDSLLPVRAHGLHILREMILAKSIVLTKSFGGDDADRELDHALDIFVQHVQEPDSFIYLNAVKGLAALTDAHGPEILRKLMRIYANEDGKQTLDTRLRIGEALVQTVQRCGEALGGYMDALLPGLYKVMSTAVDPTVLEARDEERKKAADKVKSERASEALLSPEEKQRKWKAERESRNTSGSHKEGSQQEDAEQEGEVVDEVSLLRSSALTILATAAENCPTALLPEMRYLLDWVLSILDLDKQTEVRRAATLVMVLLIRALGSNSLYRIEGDQLKRLYRTLRYVEQVDEDALCRAQARTGIADLDTVVRMEMSGGGSDRTIQGGVASLAGFDASEIRYK